MDSLLPTTVSSASSPRPESDASISKKTDGDDNDDAVAATSAPLSDSSLLRLVSLKIKNMTNTTVPPPSGNIAKKNNSRVFWISCLSLAASLMSLQLQISLLFHQNIGGAPPPLLERPPVGRRALSGGGVVVVDGDQQQSSSSSFKAIIEAASSRRQQQEHESDLDKQYQFERNSGEAALLTTLHVLPSESMPVLMDDDNGNYQGDSDHRHEEEEEQQKPDAPFNPQQETEEERNKLSGIRHRHSDNNQQRNDRKVGVSAPTEGDASTPLAVKAKGSKKQDLVIPLDEVKSHSAFTMTGSKGSSSAALVSSMSSTAVAMSSKKLDTDDDDANWNHIPAASTVQEPETAPLGTATKSTFDPEGEDEEARSQPKIASTLVAVPVAAKDTTTTKRQASVTKKRVKLITETSASSPMTTAGLMFPRSATHNRTWIRSYEDLAESRSRHFQLVEFDDFSDEERITRYLPMTSWRDCNRSSTPKEVWPPKRRDTMPFNLNRQLEPELQIQHCFEIAKLFQRKFMNASEAESKSISTTSFSPPAAGELYHQIPKEAEQPMFLAQTRQPVLVDPNGVVMTQSGTDDEMLAFQQTCYGQAGERLLANASRMIETCDVTVPSVFVVSQIWGSDPSHFLGEVLPRLVSYLDVIKELQPHLHVSFGRTTNLTKSQHRWIRLLGLNVSRIVGGSNVCASHGAWIPSPSDCRGGVYMHNMLLQTRRIVMAPHYYSNNKAAATIGANDGQQTKKIVILQREGTAYIESIRDPDGLKRSMQAAGYKHIRIIDPAKDKLWTACIPCRLQLLADTWLLIASHGPGLHHLQFLQEGSYVVEVASRKYPEEPLYSNMEQRSHVMGLHYYHYHWTNALHDMTQVNITNFVKEIRKFTAPEALIPLPVPQHRADDSARVWQQ